MLATESIQRGRSQFTQRDRGTVDLVEQHALKRPSHRGTLSSGQGVHTSRKRQYRLENGIHLRTQDAPGPSSQLRIIRAPSSLGGGNRVGQSRTGNSLRLDSRTADPGGKSSGRSGNTGTRSSARQRPQQRKFDDDQETGGQEETLGEKLYTKAKQEAAFKEPIHASISTVDQQTLIGRGPSVMMGRWGLSEVVEEELDRLSTNGLTDPALRMEQLAQKIRRGEFVRFKDGCERRSALGLARESEEKKEDTSSQVDLDAEQASEEHRAQILRELLKGDYVMPTPTSKETVLDLLSRHITRNESYISGQGNLLVEKVKRILAVQTRKGGAVAIGIASPPEAVRS